MLLTTLIVGLLGATLMFCGDMMLYYDKNDFEQSGSLEPIVAIMKTLPRKRVMLGGWIGPVAAFLYCIGFYHIVLIAEESCHTLAFAAFLLCCLGIIAGGAYHSHCAYLGLLGQDEQRKDLEIALDYFQKLPLHWGRAGPAHSALPARHGKDSFPRMGRGPVAGRSVFAAASGPETSERAAYDPVRWLHQRHLYRILSGSDPFEVSERCSSIHSVTKTIKASWPCTGCCVTGGNSAIY